jgi:ankyrin repeat protein
MVKFNYADHDKLFQWNALEYAFQNKCFVSVEMILKTCEYSKDKLSQYIEKYINDDNLLFFCLTHGCRTLLPSILENSNLITIIEHTINNCYFQKNEILRNVIETLQLGDYLDVDSKNEQGETAPYGVAMYGKTHAVQMLFEKRAFVDVVTRDDETPLYLAVDNGHKQITNLLIENSIKYPLSIGRENVKTAGYLNEKKTSLENVENYNTF